MTVPNNVPLVAAGVVASRPLCPQPKASRHGKRGPGRYDKAVSPIEQHRLSEVLAWAEQHKSEATFKPLYVGDRQEGKHGEWTWQRQGSRIVLTALIRASMVEIFRKSGNDAEVGFLWNNVLKEWNDVLLSPNAGRGYFRAVLGLTVSKTVQEVRRQERRIFFKKWRRFMRHFI